MQAFPHHYRVRAAGAVQGSVTLSTEGAEPLATHAPPQFGGPGGHWSPESLLVGAVADCFVLSFRAVARAGGLKWDELTVDVEGTLDKPDSVTRFTSFVVRPHLVLPAGGDEAGAHNALVRAKRLCLVTNSLNAACELQPQVSIAESV